MIPIVSLGGSRTIAFQPPVAQTAEAVVEQKAKRKPASQVPKGKYGHRRSGQLQRASRLTPEE